MKYLSELGRRGLENWSWDANRRVKTQRFTFSAERRGRRPVWSVDELDLQVQLEVRSVATVAYGRVRCDGVEWVGDPGVAGLSSAVSRTREPFIYPSAPLRAARACTRRDAPGPAIPYT